MEEKNFVFTENEINLLSETIIAKMRNNNRAIEIITNNVARTAICTEQKELKDLLDYLTNKD